MMTNLPAEPPDAACCGSGCDPCVKDIYQQELRIAERRVAVARDRSQLARDLYTEFRIQGIDKVSPTAKLITLGLEDDQVLGHRAGQHLIVRAGGRNMDLSNGERNSAESAENQPFCLNSGTAEQPVSGHFPVSVNVDESTSGQMPHPDSENDEFQKINEEINCVVVRQYSILSGPLTPGRFQLLIRLYNNGAMSSLIRRWQVGDLVSCRGPFGTFVHESGGQKVVHFLCQGTGIVPLVSVVQEILDNPRDETIIRLFYSVRNWDELLVADSLNQFCDYWNFSLAVFLPCPPSQPHPFQYGPNKMVIPTRLTEQFLIKHCATVGTEGVRYAVSGSKIYMKNIAQILEESCGVLKDNIFRF